MGLADVIFGTAKSTATHGKMERMLTQAGFGAVRRKDKMLLIDFEHPAVGERSLFIANSGALFVCFGFMSGIDFESKRVPEAISNFALIQNDESLLGKWGIYIDGEEATFSLSYVALGEALDVGVVKTICESMIESAVVFEKQMKKEGHL